jgi:hypothetical protein
MRIVEESHFSDLDCYSLRVDKKKGPKRYEISVSALDGGWSCTCYDFIFRRSAKGGHCKHIDYVGNFHAMKKLSEINMRRDTPKRFLGFNTPIRVVNDLGELASFAFPRIK